jgi:hypothetical protein
MAIGIGSVKPCDPILIFSTCILLLNYSLEAGVEMLPDTITVCDKHHFFIRRKFERGLTIGGTKLRV